VNEIPEKPVMIDVQEFIGGAFGVFVVVVVIWAAVQVIVS
jgi:hypothetical protein